MPAAEHFEAFAALRPVILSGWEMPVLLRAIARGPPRAEILGGWERVRGELVATARSTGPALIARLGQTLDAVRREWIAPDEPAGSTSTPRTGPWTSCAAWWRSRRGRCWSPPRRASSRG